MSTPVSAVTDPHTLSHVYEQNISVEHNWILALTVDIHSCSHVTASNMRPMVDSGAAIPCLCKLVRFSHHFPCPRNICHSRVLVETCCITLEAKLRVTCIEVLKFQVNYKVAPVVRPILSVDMLTRKRVLVVFGVQGDSSFIRFPDGHKTHTIREN